MTGTCPFRRLVCSGVYTCPQMSSAHEQHCTTVVSFRAWSSGLLHVLVFRVRRFNSRTIQSKLARMMRDGVPEADLPVGKALKRGFGRHISISPKGSHMSPTGHYTSLSSYTSCCLSYLSFSGEGLHRPLPTCPFRRMVCRAPLLVLFGERSTLVCTGHYLLVLFGGWSAELPYLSFSVRGLRWSAQAITYLSFSADGVQSSPTCPFR